MPKDVEGGTLLLSCYPGFFTESSRAPGHKSCSSGHHTVWWGCGLRLCLGLLFPTFQSFEDLLLKSQVQDRTHSHILEKWAALRLSWVLLNLPFVLHLAVYLQLCWGRCIFLSPVCYLINSFFKLGTRKCATEATGGCVVAGRRLSPVIVLLTKTCNISELWFFFLFIYRL